MKSKKITLYVILYIFEFYVLAVQSDVLPDLENQFHKATDDILKGIFGSIAEVIGTPVTSDEVTFFLYTSKDSSSVNHQIDQFNPVEVSQTEGKIYFLVHGWSQTRLNTPWYNPLTEILLKMQPDAHIVQVDWGKPANENYPSAAFATESVGQIIANVIQKIVGEHDTPIERIVVIGHSLGGQVVGFTGKKYKLQNNVMLPRIIALDPAGPLFNVRPDSRRLNKNDGKVVMVIHADGGVYGFLKPCGTIDFFPNGGTLQPGCLKLKFGDLLFLIQAASCSHQRAYQLFVEAVKHPKSFIARKCDNYNNYKENRCDKNKAVSLGDIETTQRGLFYLQTSATPPYFLDKQN